MLRESLDLPLEFRTRIHSRCFQCLHDVEQGTHTMVRCVRCRYRVSRCPRRRDGFWLSGFSRGSVSGNRRLHRHPGLHLSVRPTPRCRQGFPGAGIIAMGCKESNHHFRTIRGPHRQAGVAVAWQKTSPVLHNESAIPHDHGMFPFGPDVESFLPTAPLRVPPFMGCEISQPCLQCRMHGKSSALKT